MDQLFLVNAFYRHKDCDGYLQGDSHKDVKMSYNELALLIGDFSLRYGTATKETGQCFAFYRKDEEGFQSATITFEEL